MEERGRGEGMLSTCPDGERMGKKGQLGRGNQAEVAWGEGGKPDREGRIIMD
jgi:hypothetical protein